MKNERNVYTLILILVLLLLLLLLWRGMGKKRRGRIGFEMTHVASSSHGPIEASPERGLPGTYDLGRCAPSYITNVLSSVHPLLTFSSPSFPDHLIHTQYVPITQYLNSISHNRSGH